MTERRLRPGDWVIETGADGGGRYGRVRDPAYSPTGRVRIACHGVKLSHGRWTFDFQPSHRHLDPTQCARVMPEDQTKIQQFMSGEVPE